MAFFLSLVRRKDTYLTSYRELLTLVFFQMPFLPDLSRSLAQGHKYRLGSN